MKLIPRTVGLLFFALLPVYLFSQTKKNIVKKQNTIHYIDIDYLNDGDKNYYATEKINNGVGVRILNINKKLVDINKTVTATSFNITEPDAFKVFSNAAVPSANSAATATVAGFFSNPGTPLQGIRGNMTSEIKEFDALKKKIEDNIKQLNDDTRNFITYYKYILAFIAYQEDMVTLSNSCNMDFNKAVLPRLTDMTKGLLTADALDLNKILTPADVTEAAKGDYIKNRGIMSRYLRKVIAEAGKTYNALLADFSTGNTSNITADIKTLRAKGAALLPTLKTLANPSDEEKKILQSLQDPAQINVYDNNLSASMEFYQKADIATLDKNLQQFEQTGLKQLLDTYDTFTESNYTYYIPAQTIGKDLLVITIQITPKDNVPCSPIPRNYEIRIRTKGGIKVDFSTGLFANIGGNNFRDQSYRIDSVAGSDSTLRIVQNTGKNKFYPTIGGLMHIYWRNGTSFQPSLCFGVSTKDVSRINYHFGGSIILGMETRFIISGGVTMSKTTLINDQYTPNQIIPKNAAPTTVPTSDFNRFGYFISLTYNLSK